MRTTLDIDDDILEAAREMARREHSSAGKVVSRLLRLAIAGAVEKSTGNREPVVGGFAPSGRLVTNDAIDKLRDQEGT